MKRILLIDDEQEIRFVLKSFFEKNGFEVIEACDGEEGLEKFRENPVDLVITDIIMPKKDGLNMIDELLNESPDTEIIAMSGGATVKPERFLSLAQTLGADRIIEKPFIPDTLLKIVKHLLQTDADH